MKIEQLDGSQWQRLQTLRLAALKTDPDAFGSTYEACVAWPEARWREQLGPRITFVAVLDDHDVGMAGLAKAERADTLYLVSMWVDPRARRRGVGSALVETVIERARAQSKRRLLLDVREHNLGAIALYEARGFVATGKIENEPPPDEHIGQREFSYAIDP